MVMTDNVTVAQLLAAQGITAVVTETDKLAIHAVGVEALRVARAWLLQNGYVDGGTYRPVSVGVFVVHYIHRNRPDLELVYLAPDSGHFLHTERRSGISWPYGV